MSKSRGKFSDIAVGSVIVQHQGHDRLEIDGIFLSVEIERDGEIIDRFESPNLVVNQGLTYIVGAGLLGTTPITTWYVAPTDGTPTIVAGDTYASHAGWTEVTNYTEANRPTWQGAAGAAGVATNTANRAEFTIDTGGATIGGIAIVGGGTGGATKGDTAGGGTLFSASAFTGGNRVLVATDILRVTWQITGANA